MASPINKFDYLPKVSVVTISFNEESSIENTIKSVLEQDYINIEYIIIDGGSSDNTIEILKKYNEKINYWQSKSDKGVYDAMNQGIKRSTGEIVGILNSGDTYFKNTISEVVKVASQHARQHYILSGALQYVDSDGAEMFDVIFCNENTFKRKYKLSMPINHPATFVFRSVYDSIGLYNERMKIVADYEFVLRALRHNIPFVFSDIVFTRMKSDGISYGISNMWTRVKESYIARKMNNTVPLYQNLWFCAIWYIKKNIYHLNQITKNAAK